MRAIRTASRTSADLRLRQPAAGWAAAARAHRTTAGATLRHLLEPSERRPQIFYRGNDLIDAHNVGFAWEAEMDQGVHLFLFDTRVAGNANTGHEGEAYGTTLSNADKEALVEYLKTF